MDFPPKRNTGNQETTRSSHFLESEPTAPLKSNPAIVSTSRRTSRSQPLVLVTGIVIGIVLALLLFFLFLVLSPDASMKNVSQNPSSGSITTEISRNYLTLFITKQLSTSGLPGSMHNVQVSLAPNNEVTVRGDNQVSVLGLSITKHITIALQLSVASCQPHATIIHADLAGIPLTGFAPLFEGVLNQQLQSQQSGLPAGFTYCVTGIQTSTDSVKLVFSATPVA